MNKAPGKKINNKKSMKPAVEHHHIYRLVRKFVVFCIGGTVLLFGIILVFLPGPAIIVIPVGLTILATEFVWARQLLKTLKKKAEELKERAFPKSKNRRKIHFNTKFTKGTK